MIRITIQDTHQTISFPSNEDALVCLVGGCSVNPASLDELLIASDVYQRGIAAALMADLMEFDKTLHRGGPDIIHETILKARQQGKALELTFQVFDELTRQEATQPRACKLVILDITARSIRAPADLNILPSGEIHIHTGGSVAGPTVTYILPQGWTIQPLESPD